MQAKITQHIIWNSIKELLHRHDCVIVPDFGGFVCNREQSRIDQVSHVIVPPGKRIVFNQNLKTNDGLLAQNISERLKISYSEALLSIADLVGDLKNYLEQIKQLDVDTFGSFRLNAEANYVFIPDRLNNYLYSSFGLIPLQASPANGINKGARQTRIFKDRKEVREARRIVRAKNVGLKMLSAALVVMLFINGYIFLTDANLIGGAKINTSGINSWFDSLMGPKEELLAETKPEPIVKKEAPVVPVETATEPATLAEEAETVEISETHGLNVAETFAGMNKRFPGYKEVIEEETIIPSEEPEVAKEVPADHSKAKGKFAYHVIGGVFCKEKNARKYFNELKEQGFEAELLLNTRINCNRVSYRKVYTLEEAIQLMDSLKGTSNPEAWVLTQKED